jgi:antitoxin HicB
MAMQSFDYPFKISRSWNGGWVIACRDLPEVTEVERSTDPLEVATGRLQAALERRMHNKLEIPVPSKARHDEIVIAAPVETAVKVALYEALRQTKVSKSELGRRLGVDEKSVRRLLDPGHGFKLPRIARAIEALGKRLVIGVK